MRKTTRTDKVSIDRIVTDTKQVAGYGLFGKQKKLGLDNKGLTLIELLIAMAISTIVITMVVLFISAGSRNYSSANNEVKLQTAAQTVTNLLEGTLIEAYWIEKKVLNDQVSAFVIYSNTTISVVFFDSNKKKIYMKDGLNFSDITGLSIASYSEKANLMASYVTELDLIASVPKNEVQLRIKFENKSADFASEHTIALRNRMKTPVPTSAPG